MTKITEIDRKLQVKHLNDLSKASLKSNIKHSQNIQKQIDHTIVLTKIIQEDRAKLSRLENVIDMRDREIQELNSKQMDLLWDLAQLEKKCAELETERNRDIATATQVQKNLARVLKKGSVDN
jgi:hypothetical protein